MERSAHFASFFMKKYRKRFLKSFETSAKKGSETGKKYTKHTSKRPKSVKCAQKPCLTEEKSCATMTL